MCHVATESDSPCTVECELPSPCDEVMCAHDSSIDSGCATVDNPQDLQCVLETLASGTPAQLELTVYDTSAFTSAGSFYTIWRLASDAVMLRTSSYVNTDTGQSSVRTVIGASEVDPRAFEACEAMTGQTARFDCIIEASSRTCAELGTLTCPSR